ncbi:MAG: gas vesicle protein [Actinobacteria bacterium]|nr:gas vesicle protein [Actinomycetota bacterium]
MSGIVPSSSSGPAPVSSALTGPSDGAANLADVLERVLDKGIVIVGDIRVNLLDIELLTIKLRLVIAGVDTARRIGITWWEHDPWLTGEDDDRGALADRVRRLERRLEAGSSSEGDDA